MLLRGSVQVVVMVSVYVFCWGPYAAQSLAAILGYAEVQKTFFRLPTFYYVSQHIFSELSPLPNCICPTICKKFYTVESCYFCAAE